VIQVGHGMALRWVGCATNTDSITATHSSLQFLINQKRPNRSGPACFPRNHLCLSVDICVYLCFCFFRHICRTGHSSDAFGKSKGKHRYPQINTDGHWVELRGLVRNKASLSA
jgi:hypothetical protein